jgi:pimeloyl-ACP methyl ester carboxylesterase
MKHAIILTLMSGLVGACALPFTRSGDAVDRFVQAGDIKMGYRTYGSGNPLVMIMGYGTTMNLWEPALIDALAAHYQVTIFDNRGMGLTEAGNRDFSLEQFADDTAGLLEALGLKQASVLGWSMGSLIAEELALRHPETVDKLILYAPYCDPAMYPPSDAVVNQLTDASGTPEERGMRFVQLLFPVAWLQEHGDRVKEVFYRPQGAIDPQSVARQAQAIGKWQGCCDRLNAIRVPTLIITGSEDVLTPPQNSHYLAERIAGAQMIEIAGAGHGLMFQERDRFVEAVTEFLK